MGTLDSAALIQRLRAIRKVQGKSAQDVADVAGIPRGVIANLENGRRVAITVDEAVALCTALGVDIRVVLDDRPMPVVHEVWIV